MRVLKSNLVKFFLLFTQSKFFRALKAFWNSWTGAIIIVLCFVFFVIQPFIIPSGSMKNTLLIGDFVFVKKFSYGIPLPHLPWLEWRLLPDFKKDGHLISGEGPRRGEIVVFRNPQNKKQHYVKRCVGEPGDKIVYANQILYVSMSEGEEFMRENYENLVRLGGELFVREPFGQNGIIYDENGGIDNLLPSLAQSGKFAMRPVIFDELKSEKNPRGEAYFYELEKDNYFMVGDNRDHSADSRFWGSVPYRLIVGEPLLVLFSFDIEKMAVRWERVFKSIKSVENDEMILQKAID